ncbi:hypothetical protein EDB83DRAFT_2561183, partial [Lactarius deliciosus]
MQSRVFQTELADDQNVTIESCIMSCAAQNFKLARLEHGIQCLCGDNIVDGALTAPDSDCQMYRDGHNMAAPTVQTTDLPGQWQYSRCLAAAAHDYSTISEPAPNHVFPYHIYLTAITRLRTAFLNARPLDTLPRGGTAPESDTIRVLVILSICECLEAALYLWNGTLKQLGHTRTSVAMRYSHFLHLYVLVVLRGHRRSTWYPALYLHCSLPWDDQRKGPFLEKSTSESDPTGAYELDLLSLVNDFLMPGVRCMSNRTCFARVQLSFQTKPDESSTSVATRKIRRLVSDFMHQTDRLASMARMTGKKIQSILYFRWGSSYFLH